MTYGLTHTLRQLLRGQTLLRIRMNVAFAKYIIRGTVLDVGGGRHPDYFTYFKKTEDTHITATDGSMDGINFETDALPYADQSVDTVVLANVLEHIYNHRFVLEEMRRVLTADGQLIGFVPFWIGIHPDPHDYFRYTAEALQRMLADAGFTRYTVEALRGGLLSANFNTIVLSLPRLLRPIVYLLYAFTDAVFLWLRPQAAGRTPLGYVFTASSHA